MKTYLSVILAFVSCLVVASTVASAAEVDVTTVFSELGATADSLENAGNAKQARELRALVESLRQQYKSDGHISGAALKELAQTGKKFVRMAKMWQSKPARADALVKASELVAGSVAKLGGLVAAPKVVEKAVVEAASEITNVQQQVVSVYKGEIIHVKISSPAIAAVQEIADQMINTVQEMSSANAPVPGALPSSANAPIPGSSSSRSRSRAGRSRRAKTKSTQEQLESLATSAFSVELRVGADKPLEFTDSAKLAEFLSSDLASLVKLPVVFDIQPEVSWGSVSDVINIFSSSGLKGDFSFAGLNTRSGVAGVAGSAGVAGGLPVVPAGPLPADLAD